MQRLASKSNTTHINTKQHQAITSTHGFFGQIKLPFSKAFMHLTPLGSLHTQSSYSRVSQSHQRRMKWGFPQSAATSKVPSVERRFLPRPYSNGGELGPVRKKTRQCSWISKARLPILRQSWDLVLQSQPPNSAVTSKGTLVESRSLPRPCSNEGKLGLVGKKTRQRS